MIMVLESGGRNARAYLPRHITRALETHKLSRGEQITGATQQQPTSSRSCMVASFFFFLSFLFFLSRDLALIHSHSSDVLTPKGPCPGGD